MKPGRELDTLIAEKVMGLSNKPPEGWRPMPYPNYSTDIAVAWLLLAKFQSWAIKGNEESNEIVAAVEYEGNKYYETGVTAPYAICLAALKAVDG